MDLEEAISARTVLLFVVRDTAAAVAGARGRVGAILELDGLL